MLVILNNGEKSPLKRLQFITKMKMLKLKIGPWSTNWEEIKYLGSGGQGCTYLVKNKVEKNEGVIKILHNQRSARHRKRIKSEVLSLRRLEDTEAKVPKILEENTFKYSDESTLLYMVMEYIEGTSLLSYINTKSTLNLKEAHLLTLELVKTLKIAHSLGITHRDLKPQNIIIKMNTQLPAIVDFGLSFNSIEKSEEPVTFDDEQIGNRFLSLPENFGNQEEKRDPRSDLTQVVGVLFYCLTGNFPKILRDSNNLAPHERFKKNLEDLGIEKNIYLKLIAIFRKGFEQNLETRFQNSDELEEALSYLMNDRIAPIDKSNQLLHNYSLNHEPTKIHNIKKLCKAEMSAFKRLISQEKLNNNYSLNVDAVSGGNFLCPDANTTELNERVTVVLRYPIGGVARGIVYEFRLDNSSVALFKRRIAWSTQENKWGRIVEGITRIDTYDPNNIPLQEMIEEFRKTLNICLDELDLELTST